jgi:short-subunit dehydrogenase
MNIMITGASRGIGKELVRYFVRMGNAEIYALSRNREALAILAGESAVLNATSTVHPIIMDLEQLIQKPELLKQSFPDNALHLDILINNAGLLINKPFSDIQQDEITNMFNVNCFAPALLIKQLMPNLGLKGKSHVVNITSMGGYQGSKKFSGLSWYSATKAALACLTECLSEEFERTGMVFNCLAIGSVQTEMLSEAFPGYKAPLKAEEIAEFIGHFALTGHHFMKGKIIPVSMSNP